MKRIAGILISGAVDGSSGNFITVFNSCFSDVADVILIIYPLCFNTRIFSASDGMVPSIASYFITTTTYKQHKKKTLIYILCPQHIKSVTFSHTLYLIFQ